MELFRSGRGANEKIFPSQNQVGGTYSDAVTATKAFTS
jgi:hypothetical protein